MNQTSFNTSTSFKTLAVCPSSRHFPENMNRGDAYFCKPFRSRRRVVQRKAYDPCWLKMRVGSACRAPHQVAAPETLNAMLCSRVDAKLSRDTAGWVPAVVVRQAARILPLGCLLPGSVHLRGSVRMSQCAVFQESQSSYVFELSKTPTKQKTLVLKTQSNAIRTYTLK